MFDDLLMPVLGVCLLDFGDQVVEMNEIGADAFPARFDADGGCQMCLSDSRWPDEQKVVRSLQEAQCAEVEDLRLVDWRLVSEVEVLDSFVLREMTDG